MKKNSLLLTGAAALVALVAVSSVAYMTYAQTNTDSNSTGTPPCGKNLTEEQKAQMEAKRTEMEANQTEINNAMSQGYDAWVTAVKKIMGESAQILKEVTADNFSKYVEAQGYVDQAKDLMEKARTIYDEIGIKGPGPGMGMERGHGGFDGHGMEMGK